MTANNIKFTYKRKDNNTYQSLSSKKIRLLNESGNEILKENETNFKIHSKLNNKKQISCDISSYFNKKIPKTNNSKSMEIQNNTFMKSHKTIESYFQLKPKPNTQNEESNKAQNTIPKIIDNESKYII